MDVQNLFQDSIAGQDTADQYHHGVMRPCQLHGQTLQLYICVLTPGETLGQMQRGTLCLIDDQFGRSSCLKKKKPSQANVSDGRSLDGYSTRQRKDMDKLEFKQRPHVTRFKNCKTSLRREVATGWMAAIDHAKSKKDLDDVGSVIGNTRMSFETLESQEHES